ncbi:probable disease resistance protein At1g61190 isoform X1 [Hevea brasiliensis]|uniref:probable disease resistance protein At1g61190 isoform X1 n=1 Tax=Hevea brasiliensis TaxID=3981 RepID=UPI0025CE3F2F|nr:probable disease resistance protein At1g61190 isoform X1 [Hevea brasiliensis]XP_057986315.1 probable disease resistance protein At1g61190 isoform X1 [Hevea brasiliensis]XP_057986316.1 probable disease resistance protein At1g61190 isoform X1 [Hevea brasiliensis]XP_057986317.1 probable disease resistance protein At1g61190 isoform X1 [Hevea brasiliensis]XP_057986318.1 probable disease resistance protein At1g61190 isoform X1 [Hevea brasiliensis]XP_057986319.1 probable disease resistance protein
MDVIGAVVSIMSCLCAKNCINESISRQYGHLRNPKRKLGKLRRKMEELNALKVEVTIKLEQMQLQFGMEPKEGVKLWLRNVDEIDSEVSRITTENRQENLSWYCPNYLCSRKQFGKLVEEKIEEVADLIEKGNFSDDSLAHKLQNKGLTLPTTLLLENHTTMLSWKKIWSCLMGSKVGRIGVYGMGGIGKTTIMREINNQLLKGSTDFGCVIWVTVSKDFDLDRLQKGIAKQLNFSLSDCESVVEKSAKIYGALHRKRFVQVLDDLWEPFPLEQVGIPFPTAENGCKIVLTTRLMSICRGMETEQDVEIKVLSEDEAWNLFRDKVGKAVLVEPKIQNIARKVAKECGGFPLAIITVGRALRRETNISEWEIALTELRGSTGSIECMEDLVFARLRCSLTKLRDDTN